MVVLTQDEAPSIVPAQPSLAPAPSRLRVHSIEHLDGRVIVQTHFLPGEVFSGWEWAARQVAHEFGCEPDDVGCDEDPAGGSDLLTVNGEAVARYEIRPTYSC